MPDPVLTDAENSEVSDVVLLANTAAYLVRRLRQSGVVQALASRYSADELLSFAHLVVADHKERFTVSRAAQVYAAMVAATMRPGTEFSEAVLRQGTPAIRWASDVAQQSQWSTAVHSQTIVVTSASAVSSVSTAPSDRPIGELIIASN